MTIDQILCLDGELPSEKFLKSWKAPILACDGAAMTIPFADRVVGDMDSFQGIMDHRFQQIECQNCTDFEKALSLVPDKKTLVCGLEGGELDHVYKNLQTFSLYSRWQKLLGYVESKDSKKVLFTCQNTCHFNAPLGGKISLFGAPECKISTQGLKWDMKGNILQNPHQCSSRNEVREPEIQVTVHEGQVLIMVEVGSIASLPLAFHSLF